ncbi:acyl-CoA dehydrogenase family protein [Tsukamurella soli]|uniref:Acyl-CoA dehydrogenase family protein n=2 Tax=Tsukamurella soli TaxID=644556 RepID=A0ABP8JTW4_9ACTN
MSTDVRSSNADAATGAAPHSRAVTSDIGRYRHTDFFAMSDFLTEDERASRDAVSAFVDDEILPNINHYVENAEFPFPLVSRWAELGFVGGSVKGYGCPGLTPLAEGVIAMQLARGDGSIALINSVHSGLNCHVIDMLGSEEQKQRWLPSMARCEKLSAFALTEPDHGSDVVRMSTSAHRDGDHWVLNGAKRWIGLGSFADLVLVWARDEDDGGVGCFVIERGGQEEVEGYHATVMTRKTAMRAMLNADIRLENVRVPVENRLPGATTFADCNRCLTKSRQSIAWDGLGHAIAAYESALAYVLQREQFGRPLAKFQLIQDKLANMVADITGMQMVCVRLAQLQAEGRVKLEHAALAKLQTAAGARRVCAMARDMLGGNGVLLDYHVARHHSDVEGLYTFEGTDTVQALIVGRAVTGMSAFV